MLGIEVFLGELYPLHPYVLGEVKMKSLFKLSWSDKKLNDYVNYYVFEPSSRGGSPDVLKAPFAMSSKVAREQFSKQCVKKGLKPYQGAVIYVRLDLASGRLYLPELGNLAEINTDQAKTMFDAVKLSASMEFGSLPAQPPIAGEPTKVLRVRAISDFSASAKFIRSHLKEESLSDNFTNLPVVEANLSIMPETVKLLPENYRDLKASGGYIGPDDTNAVGFMIDDNSGGSTKNRQIHIQKTPFILINTSPAARIGESDKERVVVTGYKDFSTRGINSSVVSPVGKYTVKYLLYMGYSFKDICSSFLTTSLISDFGDLMHRGAYLLSAAKDLKKSGYADPASNKIYYCFKIDSTFPFKFKLNMPGRPYPTNAPGQSELITVVHFDPEKSILIFKTPLYFTDDICNKILNDKAVITRCEYDPTVKKVKTDEPPLAMDSQSRYSTPVISIDMKNSGITEDAKPKFEERHRIEGQFTKRKVSDYYQAMDLITNLIKKLNAGPKKVEFHDMPVIVGPWEKIMGFAGGYTNMARIKTMKLPVPLQPIRGVDWYVMPPFIMIDNSKSSSVADQTHIIIHEYRHHINEQLGVESPSYDVMSKSKDIDEAVKKRLVYLNSPDERESHVEQMQYLLGIGWTKDDVIRHFMGGEPIDMGNMRVAKKYLELVDEAMRRSNAAEEESIGEDILNKMLANMDEEELQFPD